MTKEAGMTEALILFLRHSKFVPWFVIRHSAFVISVESLENNGAMSSPRKAAKRVSSLLLLA